MKTSIWMLFIFTIVLFFACNNKGEEKTQVEESTDLPIEQSIHPIDNSTTIFDTLLASDLRIRIFKIEHDSFVRQEEKQLDKIRIHDYRNSSRRVQIIKKEELLVDKNSEKTENSLIMRASESMIEWNILEPLLTELRKECINSNQEKIRQILIKIVPEFKPQSPILDLINSK